MNRTLTAALAIALIAAAGIFTLTRPSAAAELGRYNGHAWVDANANGLRDAGEGSGSVAWDIAVVYVGVDGVQGTADDSVRTYIGADAAGQFSTDFASAGEGFYFMIYTGSQPQGMQPTMKDAGSDPMLDSDLFALPNGAWATDVFVWNGTPVQDIGIGLRGPVDPNTLTEKLYLPLLRN